MYKNLFKADFKRAQHMAVRNTVGWYEFTHQLVEVNGPDAAAVLDRIYTNSIAGIKVGREKYALMLNEQGQIVDDVVIMRMGEDIFWISNLNLFKIFGAVGAAAAGGARVQFRPITAENKMYAVQGPKSLELVNAVTDTLVDDLKFFAFEDNTVDGIPVKINRAGFTGEKYGYEIYVSPANAPQILEKLRKYGKELGGEEVTEYQLMCWTLPAEKGLLLIRDIKWLTPMEADLERFVDWSKDFTGKEALLPLRDKEPEKELVGFTLDQDDAFIPSRHLGGSGAYVYLGDEHIGQVAKFVYSYVLEKNIGLLVIDRGRVKVGDHVTLRHNEDYDAVISERTFI